MTIEDIRLKVLVPMRSLYGAPPSIRDVDAALVVYAQELAKQPIGRVLQAWERVKGTHRGGYWPALSAFKRAFDDLPRGVDPDAKSFEQITEERWAEARRVYEDAVTDPQRVTAFAEGFEVEYRRTATRAIYDRLRLGHPASVMPFLSQDLFTHMRDQAERFRKGAEWRNSSEGKAFLAKVNRLRSRVPRNWMVA